MLREEDRNLLRGCDNSFALMVYTLKNKKGLYIEGAKLDVEQFLKEELRLAEEEPKRKEDHGH